MRNIPCDLQGGGPLGAVCLCQVALVSLFVQSTGYYSTNIINQILTINCQKLEVIRVIPVEHVFGTEC